MTRTTIALLCAAACSALAASSSANAQCYTFAQYGSCCANQWGVNLSLTCWECGEAKYRLQTNTYAGTYAPIASGGWAKTAFPTVGPPLANGCIYDQLDCDTCVYTNGISKACQEYSQPPGATTC